MKKYLATAILLLTIVINSKAQVELNSGGTGAAYTLSVPGVFSLRNGIQVTFKAHANSVAAPTMNVSGTGAVAMLKDGGSSAVAAGDIKTGQIVTLAYDGSKWQMLTPVGTPPTMPTTYWNPNGTDIYNNNAGNVGIGTTTPAQKLEVQNGHILLSNTGTQSELRFKEASANGGQIISFKAPAALASNINYTLPDNLGAANNVLTNDGTGSLSWATVSSLANAWSLSGNAISAGNQLGTTNAFDLSIIAGGNAAITIDDVSQNIGVGVAPSTLYKIYTNIPSSNTTSHTANEIQHNYSGASTKTGVSSIVSADGSGLKRSFYGFASAAGTQETVGFYSVIDNDGSGSSYGVYNDFSLSTSTANQEGMRNIIDNAGTSFKRGVFTSINQTGGANGSDMTGVHNSISSSSTSSQDMFGVLNQLTNNSTSGSTYGIYQTFSGTSTGTQYGIYASGEDQNYFSGRLGIGTLGVVSSLLSIGASNQFQVDANGNLIRINNVPLSWPAANGAGFLSNNGSGTLTWSSAGVLAGGTTNYVPKWTSANALSSTSLIFDNGNVVGIGTATPSASRLNIHTTSGAGNLRLTSAATLQSASDGFSMSNDGSNVMYMTQHENDDWYFNTNGGTLGIMIKPTGNVGIGTATVNNKLDVEGAVAIGANYSGTNTAPANGLLVEGNVGIGTASPSALLHLNSGAAQEALRIQANTNPLVTFYEGANYRAYIHSYLSDLYLATYTGATQNIIFLTNNTEKMRIVNSTGNVGIGNNNPTAKLDVLSSTSSATEKVGVLGTVTGIGGGANVGVRGYATGATSTNYGVNANAYGNSGNKTGVHSTASGTGTNIAGYFSSTGGTSNYAIIVPSGSGDVGIGTSTPSFPLSVETTTDLRAGYFVNNVNSASTNMGLYGAAQGTGTGAKRGGSFEAYNGSGENIGVRGYALNSTGTNYGVYGLSSGAGTTNYGVYGSASGATTNWAAYFGSGEVYITDNLGIGVSPSYKLHVQLAATGTLAYFDNNTLAGGTALNANINTTATGAGTRYGLYSIAWYGLGTSYGVYAYGYGSGAATTNYGVWAQAGGVGGSTNWAVYASGNQYSTTGTAWTTSDEKFKSNIENFSGALDLVNKLNIKTYYYDTRTYKDMNLPKEKQFGFLAQDLEKIFPEMVMDTKLVNDDMRLSNPKNDPNYEPKMIEAKVIKTDGLLPIALQAIKEQQLIIDQLKARIEALEKK